MSQTIHSEVLGTLTYDPEWDDFTGSAIYGDKSIEIKVLFGSKPDSISETDVTSAQSAYLKLVARKVAIEEEIIKKLLDLYNDGGWRQQDDPILNRQEFLDAIEAELMVIESGNATMLGYRDGDLFGSHAIVVYFNENGNVSSIGLAG